MAKPTRPSQARSSAAIAKAGFLPRLFSQGLPRVKAFSEMGVSGVPVYAGYVLSPERNPRLIGQERYRTFADILANTSIVAAGVRYFLNVVARPSWSVEPADESSEAKKAAEWLNDVIYEELSTPWSRIVRRSGMYRFHGFSIQEWTAEKREDGTVGFSDIESRPQWTIWRWEVDDRGVVTGAWQRDPLTGRELGLPRSKIMYLVDDTLTDSPEGMGLLRHLVEPSERLKEYLEQESIGYMRDLRGIPIGRAPLDELKTAVDAGLITQEQMNKAIQDLESFVNLEKKGRKTSVVLNSQPYISRTDTGDVITGQQKWGMDLVSGEAPGLSEISKAIDRLNYDMARIIGCEHLLLGSSSSGSFALAKEKATDLYLLANSVLRDIRLQAQHDLVWPLWKLNGFDKKTMPKLKTEDVSPKDVEQIARVMRDIAVAGVPMTYDDDALNSIRDLLGLPHFDPNKYLQETVNITTARTPQQPDMSQSYYEDGSEEEQINKAWTDAARIAALNARRARWKSQRDHGKDPHVLPGGKEVPNVHIRLKDADGNYIGRVRSTVTTEYHDNPGQKYAAGKQETIRYMAEGEGGKKLGGFKSMRDAQDAILGSFSKRAEDEDDTSINKTLRELRKVIGSEAADYIHDFVHSDNPKFKGKSKAERIRMALGAYYGKGLFENGHDQRMAEFASLMEKVVPYAEAEPYREEDASIAGRSGAASGTISVDDVVSSSANADPGGPSERALHAGRGEAIDTVPGSANRSKASRRRLA